MKIAVIGAGAMGSIYGGRLSLRNEVVLVDTNEAVVSHIRSEGIELVENGETHTFRPDAAVSTEDRGPADLLILFVKALYSRAALSANSGLIGPDTYLLTLQNGSGHEELLSEFAAPGRIIIGTTEDNGTVLGTGRVRHGGKGNTNVGMLVPDEEGFLPRLKESFDACGFNVSIRPNIQQLIWDKLFVNVSLSAVTAIVQKEMGFVAENPWAFALAESLLREAVAVAHALGLQADAEELLRKIRATAEGSPDAVTSICADIRSGRKTEVDTISGSVVRAAKKVGVPVPSHEFAVRLIHALEER